MKKKHFFPGILLFLLAATLNVSCEKDDDNDNDDNNNNFATVYMKNSVFSAANLEVNKGTKVTWMNDDNMVHTVTADNNSFNSGDLQPGNSYSYTFNSTGVFTYYCKYHAGMTGTVIVVAG